MLFSLSHFSFISLAYLAFARGLPGSQPEGKIEDALAPHPQHLLDKAAAWDSSNSSSFAERSTAQVGSWNPPPSVGFVLILLGIRHHRFKLGWWERLVRHWVIPRPLLGSKSTFVRFVFLFPGCLTLCFAFLTLTPVSPTVWATLYAHSGRPRVWRAFFLRKSRAEGK